MARKNKGRNLGKYFLLDWKKSLGIVALWIFSVIAHNAIYGFFMIEEAFFFTLAFPLIPLYLIIAIIYTLDFYRKRR